MKIIYIFSFLLSLSFNLICQEIQENRELISIPKENTYKSYSLNINKHAFTVVVFPNNIKQISVSNNNIAAFISEKQANIIFVQTSSENLNEPTLTVLTQNGKLFNFVLNYKDQLENFVYTIDKETLTVHNALGDSVVINNVSDNKNKYTYVSQFILQAKNNIRSVSKKSYGLRFTLLGSYVHEDIVYLKFRIRNKTNLKYNLDTFTLYAWDLDDVKKSVAKTKLFIDTLSTYPQIKDIGPKKEAFVVLAFKKIVIANDKSMFIDMSEKNGDRSITLPIRYNSVKNPIILN